MAINLQNPTQGIQFSDPRPAGGGVHYALPQSGPAPDTAIPGFLQAMAEPYVQQQQTENFWKGYTEQLAKGSTNEAIDSESLASKFFGPTAYEQGAGFAAGSQRVQDMTQDLLSQKDELAKMDPGAFSQVVATRAKSLMTGNAITDGIMQKQLVDSMGSLVSTVSKTRFAQQQFAAYQGKVNNIISAAKNYDQVANDVSTTSSPDDGQNSAMNLAQQNLLGMLAKPYGMTDENYRKAINDSVDTMLNGKSLHSFTLLKQGGLLDAMDPKDRAGVEAKYDTAAKAAVNDAVTDDQHPELRNRIWTLEQNIQKGLTPGSGVALNLNDIAKEMDSINLAARSRAGITDDVGDVYSKSQIIDAGKGVIDKLAESNREQLKRVQGVQDEVTKQQALLDYKANLARSAYSQGNIGNVVSGGVVPSEMANGLVAQDLLQGKTQAVVQNWQTSGYVGETGAKTLQTMVLSGVGTGYTNDVDKAMQVFQQINAQSPAAALAYFGTDVGPRMQHMSTLIAGGMTKDAAWKSSFGDKDAGGQAPELPFMLRKPVESAITNYVNQANPQGLTKFIPFGTHFGAPLPFTTSAKMTLQAVLADDTAKILAGNPTIDPPAAVAQAHALAVKSGELEEHGPFVWRQTPGTQPLQQAVGLPQDRFDGVLSRQIDASLLAVNPKAGLTTDNRNSNYTITRHPDGGISVTQTLADGSEADAHFTVQDLKDRASKEAQTQIAAQKKWSDSMLGIPKSDPRYKSFGDYYNGALSGHESDFHKKYPNGMSPSQAMQELGNLFSGLDAVKG